MRDLNPLPPRQTPRDFGERDSMTRVEVMEAEMEESPGWVVTEAYLYGKITEEQWRKKTKKLPKKRVDMIICEIKKRHEDNN